jgi:hypothetical protein
MVNRVSLVHDDEIYFIGIVTNLDAGIHADVRDLRLGFVVQDMANTSLREAWSYPVQ